ncbi:MAG: M23 family metallopeptidase [Acidobacteriota bacterium]
MTEQKVFDKWKGQILNKFKITSAWQPHSTNQRYYRKVKGSKPSRHTGIDLMAPKGTPVYSISEGVVSTKYFNDKMNPDNKYGKHVVVTSDRYVFIYAHLSKFSVLDGVQVTEGTKLGEVGNTGHSLGSHLHFEVRDIKTGRDVDPNPLIGIKEKSGR